MESESLHNANFSSRWLPPHPGCCRENLPDLALHLDVCCILFLPPTAMTAAANIFSHCTARLTADESAVR